MLEVRRERYEMTCGLPERGRVGPISRPAFVGRQQQSWIKKFTTQIRMALRYTVGGDDAPQWLTRGGREDSPLGVGRHLEVLVSDQTSLAGGVANDYATLLQALNVGFVVAADPVAHGDE